MEGIDLTQLSQFGTGAGVGGVVVLFATEILTQVFGWEDRKAFITAASLSFLVAIAVWAGTHWAEVATGWQVFLGGLGNLAGATGLFKLVKKGKGND